MQRATSTHSSPEFKSAGNIPKLLLGKNATTVSLETAKLRNTHIRKRQNEIQDALQRELGALEERVILQEYKELT